MSALQDYGVVLGIVAVLSLLLLLVSLVRKRKSADLDSRLRRAGKGYMANFLIPDGQGGEIHIEHALLCARGIVLVDYKDIEGNIFGSDTMQDWTVITGKKRFTFANPQNGLLDRTAAVAHLLPDIPVEGYIAFSERGKFTKGLPAHVAALDTLLAELTEEGKGLGARIDAYWPAWEKLRDEAVVARVARLMED